MSENVWGFIRPISVLEQFAETSGKTSYPHEGMVPEPEAKV